MEMKTEGRFARAVKGILSLLKGVPQRWLTMTERPVDHEGISSLVSIDQIIHAPIRLTILIYLYVVESVDFVFLKNITGLPWGNLSTHLNKLEKEGYVETEKGYKGKRPNTMIRLSDKGRTAFREYKKYMKKIFDDLPD